MTATKRAKEIYFEMLNAGKGLTSELLAKYCALIAVNKINDVLCNLEPTIDEDLWLYREMKETIPYWQDVRDEIKKL